MLKFFKEIFDWTKNRFCVSIFLLSLQPEIKQASLAQLVEQLTRNEQVVGSSPMGGSYVKSRARPGFLRKSLPWDSNPRPAHYE